MDLKRIWRYEKSKNLFFYSIKNPDSKKALIFLHGLTGSRRYWPKEYQALSQDFSLYFVDFLGMGYSAKPDIEYTKEIHIKALTDFIQEHVIEKEIYMVGYSVGALLALQYLYKKDINVKKVILLALPFYRTPSEARIFIRSNNIFRSFFVDTPHARFVCRTICFFTPLLRIVYPFVLRRIPKEVAQDVALHTSTSYFSTLNHVLLKQNIPQILGSSAIKKKIVLIYAKGDRLISFKNVEELSNKYKIRTILLEGGSHHFPLFESEKVVKILRKTLL